MKYRYKRPQFDFYDAVALECWLSDMAKKGLIFVGTTLAYFRFEKSKPINAKYRVEPMIDENETPPEEIISAYNEAGWEFISCHSKLFFIWKSTDESATELHSDPIVQSESYRRLCKKLTKQAVVAGVAVLAVFAIYIGGFIASDRPVSLFLASPLHLVLLVSEFFIIVQTVQQASRAIKIKKMLADGFSLEHKKDYRKQHVGHRIISAVSLLLPIMILVISIFTSTSDWSKSIVDIDRPIPYIPLDVIEQSNEFAYKEPHYYDDDIDYNNYADFSWSPFVPEHYEVYQDGADQTHKWPDGSGYYAPSASTEYYRLSIAFFAPLLFEELIDIHLWEDEEYTITELDAFERTVIAADSYGFMKHLFVLDGNQVFYLRYYGYADVNDVVPLLAEVLSRN